MPREWGATGAFDYFPPRLSDENKEHIYELLKGSGATDSEFHLFVGELAEAVGRYDSHANERERTKPAAVKANLKRGIETAKALLDVLNNLDGNSKALLCEVGAEDFRTFQGYAARSLTGLMKALKAANEYPKSGNLVEHHRLLLAADVVDAMRCYLKIEPTLTRGGLYEAILEVALKEATGKEARAVHALARRALFEVVKLKAEGGPTGYEFVEKST